MICALVHEATYIHTEKGLCAVFAVVLLWECNISRRLFPISFPMLCLDAVELTEEFPKGHPSLVLRSVYHCMDGLPCQSVVTDYPYSPRWGSEEMAERLRSYLMYVGPRFRGLSKEKGEFL
jgi:hypothetical protein